MASSSWMLLCQRWGLWWKWISIFATYLDTDSFSIAWYIGVMQLISIFLLEGGKCSICSCIVRRRGIQEPSTWSSGSRVSLGWDNVKAYVLCCFPKSLSRILHQLLIVVICLKMCPLLAKFPSLFYLPISLLAFSLSPNFIIFASILILWSTSEKIQTNTLTPNQHINTYLKT